MEPIKKRLVKKKEPTNIQKAQNELEEIYSDLFDKYVEIDINDKFYYTNKDLFIMLYEDHKRAIEIKYKLEPFTLIKSKFDTDDILDSPSNVIIFLDENVVVSKLENVDITKNKNEIDKLKKKIQRAELTLKKDKQKLEELLSI
jgi:hypothetical protein